MSNVDAVRCCADSVRTAHSPLQGDCSLGRTLSESPGSVPGSLVIDDSLMELSEQFDSFHSGIGVMPVTLLPQPLSKYELAPHEVLQRR